MLDLIYICVVLIFFALTFGLIWFLDLFSEDKKEE